MARFEAPLDPDGGPVQRFAYDLRHLREAAGRPSYRVLAARVHYSTGALSQAASGRSLPTLPVTLAYVRACGGETVEWERRWREVNDLLQQQAHIPSATATPGAAAPTPAGEPLIEVTAPPSAPASGRTRRRRAIALAAGGAAVVCVMGLAVFLIADRGRPSPSNAAEPSTLARPCPSRTSSPGPAESIADCADPTRSGCAKGIVTLASTEVHVPAGELSGWVELRYSRACRAAWGRFHAAEDWHPRPGTVVKVWTIRPADGRTAFYSVEFGGPDVVGDMLFTAKGCVAAEVSVVYNGVESPVAVTTCRNSDGEPGAPS